MVDTPAQRLVPGAPPPAPLTKSQLKKKRKSKKADDAEEASVAIPDATAAALTDKAPQPEDIASGALAPELVVQHTPAISNTELESTITLSPIVDLITKRLKTTNKKITRISSYAATDPEKLNDDQKRTLKTLPILEAVAKELSEVKKAVEVHEAELSLEIAQKQAETEATARTRIAEAVSASETASKARTSEIISFLRFRNLIYSGELGLVDSALSDVVSSISDTLVGPESEAKEAVIHGLYSGEGQYEGVTYARLLEFQRDSSNIRAVTPTPDAPLEAADDENVNHSISSEDAAVSDAPLTTSNSFHFMQASELETPSGESAEWVSVEPPTSEPEHTLTNGHVEPEAATAALENPPSSLSWGDEPEGDSSLPSLNDFPASFNPSGAATPVVASDGHGPSSRIPVAPITDEDDGFVQAKGGRARGRGRGGERGGYRGRGEGRGGFRGERGRGGGGFRNGEGRGGFRGGDGEGRGGFRGGRGGDGESRDGFRGGRGGGDGEQNGSRGGRGGGDNGFRGGRGGGDGEHHGRGGRGRGRGRGGDRGAPPS